MPARKPKPGESGDLFPEIAKEWYPTKNFYILVFINENLFLNFNIFFSKYS